MSSPRQKAEKIRYTKERRDKEKYPEHPEVPRKEDGTPIRKSGGQPGPRAQYEDPVRDAQVAAKQKVFLGAFPKIGTIRGTVVAVNDMGLPLEITVNMVNMWKRDNIQYFRDRFESVQIEFSEYLEDIALERIKEASKNDRSRVGSDILLITLLNGNNPEKYKRYSNVTDTTGKETLSVLRGIKKDLKRYSELKPDLPEDDRESNREAVERLLHDRFPPSEVSTQYIISDDDAS
jgi:hypothetical protein